MIRLKPLVRIIWWNRGYGVRNAYANDLSTNLPSVDYFIVAGTPQWIYKNETIYRACLRRRIPLALIGVGKRNVVGFQHRRLMKQLGASGLCEIALARDQAAAKALEEFRFKNIHLIPDPAFFIPKQLTELKTLNLLGWRHGSSEDPMLAVRFPMAFVLLQMRRLQKRRERKLQRVKYNQMMLEIFESLSRPKLVVVHDNREIGPAEKLFGSDYVYYSTDYKKMLKVLARAHTYVGSRIHGAIPCLIHGARAHLLYRNRKADAVNTAVRLLGEHYEGFRNCVRVSFLDDEVKSTSYRTIEFPDTDSLDRAIEKQKIRIRQLLKETRELSGYMAQDKK